MYKRGEMWEHQVQHTGVARFQYTRFAESVRISLPSKDLQRSIAEALNTLDAKIELIYHNNKTLEALARAIFESWFVDFDPVRAKAEGIQPVGMDTDTAALFPGEFEESNLGEIPKGWEIGSILSFSNLLSGGTPSTKIEEYWNGNIKWVSAKDVSAAKGTFVLDTERKVTKLGVENSSTKILPRLTTIVTARGTVGSYCILAEPMAMNQTNYGLKSKKVDSDYFVFFSLANLVAQLKQNAYGTIFDTVTTRIFENSQVIVPPLGLIREFNSQVQPMMEMILQNLQQSHTLAALRDALLPRLMSGEVRVEDVVVP
jgi:type I restriction enzyme S subunit